MGQWAGSGPLTWVLTEGTPNLTFRMKETGRGGDGAWTWGPLSSDPPALRVGALGLLWGRGQGAPSRV